MLITALLMTGALMGGDPDGVVSTAPATAVDLGVTTMPDAPSVEGAVQAQAAHNLTTDEQIDRWLASRSTEDRPYARAVGEALDDGKPHGEVSVGFGTGGYRDYGVTMTMPIGENGRVSLSYRQVENGYPYGYGYYPSGYGYGYDGGFGYGGYGLGRFDDGYVSSNGRRSGAAAEFDTRRTRPDASGQPPGVGAATSGL